MLVSFYCEYIQINIIFVCFYMQVTKFSVGTGILWYTYAGIKWNLDSTPVDELLEKSIHNERAILVYAILATIFTVSMKLNVNINTCPFYAKSVPSLHFIFLAHHSAFGMGTAEQNWLFGSVI